QVVPRARGPPRTRPPRVPAPPLDAQQADPRRDLAHDLLGPVRRPVRRDDHLEAIGGIVTREGLFELPPDVALLVVRTDDEGDRRLECPPGPPPPARPPPPP